MTRHRNIRRRIAPGIALSIALAATGAANAAERGSEVVARLGSSDITVAQLQGFVRGLDPVLRQQAIADTQLMNRLVRAEIERMAVLHEAKAQNWEQRPDVAAQIARARDQVIAASFLASIGAPPPDYPPAADIQTAYDMNRDKFMMPRQYDLQQIFVALPAGGDKNAEALAQKKAEDLARKAKAKNADFAALARQNSDHRESAERGGEMGWAPETQIVAEIRNQIAGMSKGDVSEPIRAADGWHIIRLVDTKPEAPRPLSEVKDTIVPALRQAKTQANQQTYIAGLLQKTPISVNEIGLRKIFDATMDK